MFDYKVHWSICSEKDKRWNCSGVVRGGLSTAEEAVREQVKRMKKKFGKMPKDLEYSVMKE